MGGRAWVRPPDVKSGGPALTTKLELFPGRPSFNSSVMLVNSQLASLQSVDIFRSIMFI